MKTSTARKEIQMMVVPKVNTIKKYDNFNNVDLYSNKKKETKKSKNTSRSIAINRKIIIKTLLYAGIMLSSMLIQMKITYDASELGKKKAMLERNLKDVKSELENLENLYLSSSDLKQIEVKLKNMGYVYNDSIQYIELK